MAITTTTFSLYVKFLPGVLRINHCSLLVFVTNVYSHAIHKRTDSRIKREKKKRFHSRWDDHQTITEQTKTHSLKESKSEWIKWKTRDEGKKWEFMRMKRKSVWLEICIYSEMLSHSSHSKVYIYWLEALLNFCMHIAYTRLKCKPHMQ